MATTVYARVDVSVSPYMTITGAGGNQPDITTGLTSATFPTGYFGGGSFLGTLDNDNDVECLVGGVVLAEGSSAVGALVQILNDAASGVLILRNSGFTTSDKDVAADSVGSAVQVSDIMIHAKSSAGSEITKLSVANKDVFVIPYTGKAVNGYYAQNVNTTGTGSTKNVYLEYCFINNEE